MFLTNFLILIPIFSLTYASQSGQIPMRIPPHMGPTLADLLTLESRTSIFFDYARELELSQTFGDPHDQITILAPINKAVIALPRKPHQDPQAAKMGVVITEEDYENQSKENVRRWVSSHIIPESPIPLRDEKEPSLTYETLFDDKEVFFLTIKGSAEDPEWKNVLVDGHAAIIDRREAVNGVLYIIDDTIKLQ